MSIETIFSISSTIVVALLLFYFQRAQSRRDKKRDELAMKETKKIEKRTEAQKKEALLLLDMISANCKLTYAIVMAYKRGELNGEVEEGLDAYEDAKINYYRFLNEQAKEHLNS